MNPEPGGGARRKWGGQNAVEMQLYEGLGDASDAKKVEQLIDSFAKWPGHHSSGRQSL